MRSVSSIQATMMPATAVKLSAPMIMSYFEASNHNSLAIWSRTESLTPMIYDILAVQAYYGVDAATHSGSTTYGFNSTANRAVFAFDINCATPVFTILGCWRRA